MKKYISEFLGTFILVLFGTGVATFTRGNIIITSLAFGLAIVAIAYSFGKVSGGHVNPAVSLSMLLTKRMTKKDFIYYTISQILGAIAGTGILYILLSNTDIGTANLGANYYGELSSYNISIFGALMTEVILTAVFVYTILEVTNDEKKSNVSGIVIGLTLTLVHLIGINLTGTSVNPARSIAPAIYLLDDAIKQVWVFIVGPLIGASVAAILYNNMNVKEKNLFKKKK